MSDQVGITKEDREMLKRLADNVKKAAPVLREKGEQELASSLVLQAGFAIGLVGRIDQQRQRVVDAIAGALV